MPIIDLFSKRQKRLRGEQPDVLVYDEIPKPLRVQIIFIWRKAIGETIDALPTIIHAATIYEYIRDTLREEFGVFELVPHSKRWQPNEELEAFFEQSTEPDKLLDQVELTFRLIEDHTDEQRYRQFVRTRMTAAESVEELNTRFLEHGIGYQYESGFIIRADSTLLHAEAVKPALQILSRREFEGANAEFLKAHHHYRHGHYKESVNECLKAFESVLKIICDKRGWRYNQSDTARRLIEICFENELVPIYLQSQFSSLRSILQSGVPTARNKASGHGQGVVPTTVPSHLAQYVLHLTASTILFLSKSDQEL